MNFLFYLVLFLAYVLCAWRALKLALHMFQLNSYQDLSYKNYLRANRKKFRGPKQSVPCFLMLLGGLAFAWLAIAGYMIWQIVRKKMR